MLVTLKTLPYAKKQEVFDQVVTHLRTQGQKATGDEGCAYRVGELKCAAGCLIADDEYVPEMDQAGTDDKGYHTGSNWSALVRRNLVPKSQHDNMIMDLQCAHDGHAVSAWEGDFQQIAKQHNVSYIPR